MTKLTGRYIEIEIFALTFSEYLECDFIVRKDIDDYFYIQVAMTIAEQSTEDREYRPFSKIKDNKNL